MSPFDLPAVFVLPVEVPFATVRRAVEAEGFAADGLGIVPTPLIAGEWERASWNWGGTLPTVRYTFNAVVRLRVLDVGTVPPPLRAALAQRIGRVAEDTVRDALFGDDERRRLWAIWAARETERIDLLAELGALRERVTGLVREELDGALSRLFDLADAQAASLVAARIIAETGVELLAALDDLAVLAMLAPTEEDCHDAFHPSVAAAMWATLSRRTPPRHGLRAKPAGIDDIAAASAGALRWPNVLSARFPRGYRQIAGWLTAERVWLAWRGREPDGGTRLMDGLVFLRGRWVWIPRPYRELEPMILPVPGDHRRASP